MCHAFMTGMWEGWFEDGANDPAKLFEKAAVQWFWSWAQDAQITAQYGAIQSDIDIQYMLFNWLGKGMQSAKELLSLGVEGGANDLNTTKIWHQGQGFLGIAQAVVGRTGFDQDDGMWSWANLSEDMYTQEGRELCVNQNFYVYIYPDANWEANPFVIMNMWHVRIMDPYRLNR